MRSVAEWRRARRPCAFHHLLQRRPRRGGRPHCRPVKSCFQPESMQPYVFSASPAPLYHAGRRKKQMMERLAAHGNSEATAAESSRLISFLFPLFISFLGGGAVQDRLSEATGGNFRPSFHLRFPRSRPHWRSGSGSAPLRRLILSPNCCSC